MFLYLMTFIFNTVLSASSSRYHLSNKLSTVSKSNLRSLSSISALVRSSFASAPPFLLSFLGLGFSGGTCGCYACIDWLASKRLQNNKNKSDDSLSENGFSFDGNKFFINARNSFFRISGCIARLPVTHANRCLTSLLSLRAFLTSVKFVFV